MKINSMTVSKGLTLNLGNYESKRIDVSITVTPDSSMDTGLPWEENESNCFREAWTCVSDRIESVK